MRISPVVSLISLAFLMGCEPLPKKIDARREPQRPVAPLWFEKKGYKIEPPRSATAPAIKIDRKTVNVKPGKKLSPEELTELLTQAEDKAVSAANLTESAQSKEDWSLVIDQWQKAIALLKPAVPMAGTQKSVLQQKITQYDRALANAQQQASTNPQQIQTGEAPKPGGRPLIVTSEEKPAPSPSPSASAAPSASPTPSSEPKN
jgi:hypothetical protein